MAKLPEGFELETPEPAQIAKTPQLPEGFELEQELAADAAGVTDVQKNFPSPDTPRIRITPTPPPGFEPEQQELPEADFFRHEKEFGKGVVRGARDLPATALQGLVAARPPDDVLGGAIERIQQGADIDQAVAAAAVDTPPTLVTERPEYKLGETIKGFGKETFAAAPGWEKSWSAAFGQGAGSMLAGMGTGLIPVVGPYLAAGTFAGAGMGEAAESAIRNKASEEQIRTAAQLGTIPGLLDTADLALPGVAKGAKVPLRMLFGGAIEGTQEATQQLGQNIISKTVHKPDQNLFEDVPESFVVGSVLGGAVPGIQGVGQRAADIRAARAAPDAGLSAPSLIEGPNPVFYSQLKKAAEERLPKVGTPEQILATLKQSPGVKQEEIEYTGLESWLARQGSKVKKEDLIAELEDRQIVVEETVKQNYSDDEIFRLKDRLRALHDQASRETDQARSDELYLEIRSVADQLERLEEGGPEYSSYAVKGPKKNYRELLLRTPGEQLTAKDLPKNFSLSDRQPDGAFYVFDDEGNTVGDGNTEERAIANYFQNQGERSTKGYIGPHWREQNVLAHVRFSDRVDQSTGEPMLFIDEIQSDWHQTGRKEGYRTPLAKPAPTRAEVRKAEKLVQDTYNNVLDAVLGRPATVEEMDPQQDAYWKRDDKVRHAIYALTRDPNDRSFPDNVRAAVEIYRDAERLMREAYDARNAAVEQEVKVPDAPFKTSWHELAFKRMLRWAADNGYSRVAWTNGRAIGRVVAGGDSTITRGLVEFYDRVMPSMAKKYAKRLGGVYGQTTIEGELSNRAWAVYDDRPGGGIMLQTTDAGRAEGYRIVGFRVEELPSTELESEVVHYIDVPFTALTAVQHQGLPLFSQRAGRSRVSIDKRTLPDVRLSENTRKLTDVIQKLINDFQIRRNTRIVFYSRDVPQYGEAKVAPNGDFVIRLNLAQHQSLDELYATATHELGHLIMWDKFYQLPSRDQLAIREAYNRFRQETPDSADLNTLWKRRDNAVANYYTMQAEGRDPDVGRVPLYMLSPERRQYWSGFDEWFAEQVAKWATSSPKPLSRVDQVFQRLGAALRKLLERAARLFGRDFRADAEVAAWLDSFITDSPSGIAAQTYQENDQQSTLSNRSALSEVEDLSADEIEMSPEQLETQGIRTMFSKAFAGMPMPPGAKSAAAVADRYNYFYKLMVDILQLAELNPRFTPLLRYTEKMRSMHGEEQKLFDAGMRILKRWNGRSVDAEALSGLINDVANMTYRTPTEVAAGVQRHPTPSELNTLIAKYKASPEAVKLFHDIRKLLDTTLILAEQNAIVKAQRIADPVARVNKILQIQERTRQLRTKPYFPFMWFGRHSVSVRDAAGNLVEYRTVERRGLRSAKARQRDLVEELTNKYGAGFTVTPGIISQEASVFKGFPSYMLDQISVSGMKLTTAQRDLLEESYKFELNPGAQFKGHFAHKETTPGYSMDFQRAFAFYMFHFGKFYARTKYVDGLRQDIFEARAVPDVKAQEIAIRMGRHFDDTVTNPKTDWAFGKAFAFLWFLGYVPASAFLNLSQTPMITFPFMSAKFGEHKATPAILKAMLDVKNTYRKRTSYEGSSEFLYKALSYGIKTGRISEAMAPELAGIAEGRNLTHRFGGNTFQRGMHIIQEKAGWMFEMAEQFNRRVAFRAALDLAMKNPNAPYVKEAVSKYQEEYNSLLGAHTPREAAAIITASHATDQTQFVYAPYARAMSMQGKFLGTVFVFKKYLQSLLFLLFNNKSDFMWRFIIVAMAAGGLMGFPGADDLKDILKLIGHYLFGKDFDIEREVRRYLRDTVSPDFPSDMVLHGLARRGFGLPAAINAAGNSVGMPTWFPTLDRSRAISPGSILPFELGKLFGPGAEKNPERALAEQTQRASGAVFGTGFNLYKFLMDKDLNWSDPKRWERAIPRSMASLSKSWRAYHEERERTRKGPNSASTIIKFDPRDPEQMMEILAMAGGYQPLRLSEKWDLIRNTQEVTAYYELRKQGLLAQFFEARMGGDTKETDAVLEAIRNYNKDLPDFAKGLSISKDTIKRSMEARARQKASQEVGVPVQKSKRGIAEEMKTLFPQTVEQRRVRTQRVVP